MAVNVPNPGNYLAQISTNVVGLRNNFAAIVNQLAYIDSMGGATFLEAAYPAGMGLAAGDAAVVLSTLGNLAALAAVYNGGAPGAALNYSANSQPLWGGQLWDVRPNPSGCYVTNGGWTNIKHSSKRGVGEALF
jgi:hypothetical protein